MKLIKLEGRTVCIFGYRVWDDSLPRLLYQTDCQIIVATLNPHSYVMSCKDAMFNEALHGSSILVADGVGIEIASIVLRGHGIQRITGSDLWASVMNELQIQEGRCFFLGSSDIVLMKIKERLALRYPNVAVDTYSPPFTESFGEYDEMMMTEKVNSFRPDVLFVGMTAPKQEKWVWKNRDRLDASVIISIGAVFDFIAGTRPRAPSWMCRVGLEWLYRFLLEPRRMFQRNFVSTPLFICHILRALLRTR